MTIGCLLKKKGKKKLNGYNEVTGHGDKAMSGPREELGYLNETSSDIKHGPNKNRNRRNRHLSTPFLRFLLGPVDTSSLDQGSEMREW